MSLPNKVGRSSRSCFTSLVEGATVVNTTSAVGRVLVFWGLWKAFAVGCVLVAVTAAPDRAAAQQLGTITGEVLNASTQQPLSAVQVFLAGSDRGALTRADGTYVVPNVPVGMHTVEARQLGYQAVSQGVTVSAGETVQVDFELTEQALALDEILVTGTAGQARRREIGNTIAQINPGQLSEVVTGLESLLQGRSAGVSVDYPGPNPGEAAIIRLRGITSTSQGNAPLVYVDGVRVASSGLPLNQGTDRVFRSSNSFQTSFGDINPADIERIEIIKGPAATTLYGTDAASGVIQIFTKRGTPGAANWTFETQQGFAKSVKFSPEPEPYYYLDRVLRTARRQEYNLSVSGASGGVSYFLSGSAGENEGIMLNDLLEHSGARGNFRFEPSPTLALEFNTGYTRRNVQEAPSGHNSQGLGANTTRCPGGCALGDTWEERILQILDWEILSQQNHLISGLTANWTPSSAFSHRVTVGVDYLGADMTNNRPFGFILAPTGQVASSKYVGRTTTLDYVGNYIQDFSDDLRVTFSAGAQYQDIETSLTRVGSNQLAGPGVPTASSGANVSGVDERAQVISGGLFGQALIGYQDRYFLTAGLRMDGYSAFGENLGLEPYPKVSVSYVVSDEDWWSARLGSMKLRAAYGWAGRAPGAFDAVRTWQPANILGEAGFTTNNVGNADLGPERSSEIEAGFDSEWGNGRVAVEFTYYRRLTEDALFSVRQAPSGGWGGSQLENVGKIRNSGIELGLNADLVRTNRLTWRAGLQLSTNESETVSLGGAPSFSLGSFTEILEGLPAPVLIGSRLISDRSTVGVPEYEDDFVWGPNYPTEILSPSTSLSLPRGITLSARGEYQRGAYMWNRGLQVSEVRHGTWFCLGNGPRGNHPIYGGAYDLIDAGRVDELTVDVRVRCNPDDIPRDAEIVSADYFKVRDISLQVALPISYFGVDVSDATLTISAVNYIRWINDDFFAFEPEIGDRDGPDNVARATTGDVPPGKSLIAAIRFRF